VTQVEQKLLLLCRLFFASIAANDTQDKENTHKMECKHTL